MKIINKFSFFLVTLFLAFISLNAQHHHYRAPVYEEGWTKPSHHPDHIILNLTEDPANSMSVTWRTDEAINKGIAEIAIATAAPKFWRYAETYEANTELFDATEVLDAGVIANYHTVTFKNLMADTTYAYRVGDGDHWSEWFHFRTASNEEKPFSFLYVGDAQNYILELWSRLIREGFKKAPDASFFLHAGDLVSDAHSEQHWHEWFTAGGFIHSMIPSIMTPGNHEYDPLTIEDEENDIESLSAQWRPQFNLPENGISGLEETVYYVDYQNCRLISLNSIIDPVKQKAWLENILSNNPMKWTIITYHHPLYSASERRDNPKLREAWKPLFDKYRVDLVLQGHDHSYARGRANPYSENVVDGMNTRDHTGTVYVVSVSGGKMYNLNPDRWNEFEDVEQDRGAENTQLFQIISVDGDRLSYESYTATGELYDAFDLEKSGNEGPNLFIERKEEAIPARYHHNTIHYQEKLPENLKKDIMNEYPGFEINRVLRFDEEELSGYNVRLYKDNHRIDLKIDTQGNVIKKDERFN